MTDDDPNGHHGVPAHKGPSEVAVMRKGEGTQPFSALQQQLLCAAIHFFHRHIRSDPDVLQRMEGNQMFKLFFEVPYHNKPDLNRIFPDSVHDCSALHVCSFILSILHQGIFSVSAFIVSVIYLSRFKESSHITLHACTWRPLFLTALLLADKMWEDKPVRNSSLAKLFPVLNNLELNKMESEFLSEIRFNVLVKPDLFCSFCEKLLAEHVHQEITRCVNQSEYAATLQADQQADAGASVAQEQAQPPAPTAEAAMETVKDQILEVPTARKEGMVTNQDGLEKFAAPHSSRTMQTTLRPVAANGQPLQHQQQVLQQQLPQQVQQHAMARRGEMQEAPTSSRNSIQGPHQRARIQPVPWTVGGQRSQSAGPTTCMTQRRMEAKSSSGSVAGQPQLPAQQQPQQPQQQQQQPLQQQQQFNGALASWRAGASVSGPPGSTSMAAQAEAKSGGRSVSVHPLPRNESAINRPVAATLPPSAEPAEAAEKTSRPHHHPLLAAAGVRGIPVNTQPSRHSLPAKCSTYVPLVRTAVASRNNIAAANATGTVQGAPAGSGSESQGNLQSGSFGAAPGVPSYVQASGGGAMLRPPSTGPTVTQSPRSPVSMSPAQVHYEQQRPTRHATPFQVKKQQQDAAAAAARAMQHLQQASEGQQQQQQQHPGVAPTPPVPTSSHSGPPGVQQRQQIGGSSGSCGASSNSKMPQSRAMSPAGSVVQTVAAPHPTRAASAPRVAGYGCAGANVRTAVAPAGQPQARGQPSPALVTMGYPLRPAALGLGAGMPVNLRNTINHLPGPARAASPVGLAPGSPTTSGAPGGFAALPLGAVATATASGGHEGLPGTSRGRSPPPSLGAPAGGGPPSVRAPRAITPSSLVKGISQGIHAGGMVQRNSLGGAPLLVQR